MEHLGAVELPRNPSQKYVCYVCDYYTSHLGDWNKHIATGKHKKRVIVERSPHECACGKVFTRSDSLYRHRKVCFGANNCDEEIPKIPELLPIAPKLHRCDCGATFTRNSNLKRHNKLCLHGGGEAENVVLPTVNNTEVLQVLGLLQAKMDNDNALLKGKLDRAEESNELLKEEMKSIKSGVLTAVAEPKIVNNINFFLNERCGNAIPIQDFVRGLVIDTDDVDYALVNGKASGIANIIEKQINELGVYKRPLHCTDVKRGTMYVKGAEGWGKESGEVTKLIQDVNHAQVKGIKIWEAAHPRCFDTGHDSEKDKWFKVVKCLTNDNAGVGTRKISKRCYEASKINQEEII